MAMPTVQDVDPFQMQSDQKEQSDRLAKKLFDLCSCCCRVKIVDPQQCSLKLETKEFDCLTEKLFDESSKSRHAKSLRENAIERSKVRICIAQAILKVSILLGKVAFGWGSTILLGGFVSGLTHYDFWVISGLVLGNAARLFGITYTNKIVQGAIPPFPLLTLIFFMPCIVDDLWNFGIRNCTMSLFFKLLFLRVLEIIDLGSAMVSMVYPVFRLRNQNFGDAATTNQKAAMRLYYGMVLTEASLFILGTIVDQCGSILWFILGTIVDQGGSIMLKSPGMEDSKLEEELKMKRSRYLKYLDYPSEAVALTNSQPLSDNIETWYLEDVYKTASQKSVMQAVNMRFRDYVFEGTVKSSAELGSPDEELIIKIQVRDGLCNEAVLIQKLNDLYWREKEVKLTLTYENKLRQRVHLLKYVLDYISEQLLSLGYVREQSCLELASSLLVGDLQVLVRITEEDSKAIMLLTKHLELKETVRNYLLWKLMEPKEATKNGKKKWKEQKEMALLVLARFCTRLGDQACKYVTDEMEDCLLQLARKGFLGAALVLHRAKFRNEQDVHNFIETMLREKRWSELAPFLDVLTQVQKDALDLVDLLDQRWLPGWASRWIPEMSNVEKKLNELKNRDDCVQWLQLMSHLRSKDDSIKSLIEKIKHIEKTSGSGSSAGQPQSPETIRPGDHMDQGKKKEWQFLYLT